MGVVGALAAKPMIEPLSIPGTPVSAHSAECIDGSAVSQRGGVRAFFFTPHMTYFPRLHRSTRAER